MTTKVYERSLRAETCEQLLQRSNISSRYERCIILPIPTTRDGITVHGRDITLEDALADTDGRTLVIGYGIPAAYADGARGRGAIVCDALHDERFLEDNGELTAYAALGIILNTEKRAPVDMHIGVVGYGRIGSCMTRLLLYLGASVTVYTSREGVMMELCEQGVSSRMSGADAELGDLDLLINTAPAGVFVGESGSAIPEGLRVIDLASGVNFPGVESVEKYPSVPARMFPYSAGRIWFESVKRTLGCESEAE